jgi:hypothetical protein
VKIANFFCAALLLGGCADDRPAQDARTVYVAGWTHLSVADKERIAELVRQRTRQPIQGIVRWKPNSQQIAVFTGFGDANIDVNPWTEHQLEKRGGSWQIVAQAIISPGMVHILLSYPPDDTRKPKKT